MGSKLYVGGLPYSTTQAELTDLFSAHGTVQSANVVSDKWVRRGDMAEKRDASGTRVPAW